MVGIILLQRYLIRQQETSFSAMFLALGSGYIDKDSMTLEWSLAQPVVGIRWSSYFWLVLHSLGYYLGLSFLKISVSMANTEVGGGGVE